MSWSSRIPRIPQWEATTGAGVPVYDDEERAAIAAFVAAGGGLVVLAETEQAKYGSNLGEVLSPFGLGVLNATVQDYSDHHRAPSWIFGTPTGEGSSPDLFHGVEKACFYRAGVVTAPGGDVVAVTGPTATLPGAGLVATAAHGEGRVIVFADSDLFGDDCIEEFDHARLWLNTLFWVGLPRFARAAAPPRSPVLDDPHWADLLAATESLRARQSDDGSVDLSVNHGRRGRCRGRAHLGCRHRPRTGLPPRRGLPRRACRRISGHGSTPGAAHPTSVARWPRSARS